MTASTKETIPKVGSLWLTTMGWPLIVVRTGRTTGPMRVHFVYWVRGVMRRPRTGQPVNEFLIFKKWVADPRKKQA